MKAYIPFLLGIALLPSLAASEEMVKLHAPGDKMTRMVNEVGLWKTPAAATHARLSLASSGAAEWAMLSCVAKPGSSAVVISRSGKVAKVKVRIGLFDGCEGFVRTDFLSRD